MLSAVHAEVTWFTSIQRDPFPALKQTAALQVVSVLMAHRTWHYGVTQGIDDANTRS